MEDTPNIDESPDLANWMRTLRFALPKSKDKLENKDLINNLFSDLKGVENNIGEGR
jgi:hypothetical protein